MNETKEEIRIVITYDSENRNASTYLNNPDVDTETLVIMLCSHINLTIRNLMLGGLSLFEATATVQKALAIATDRIAKESAEDV
ncbi:MAG: hypothetical protein K2J25_06015 [Oscillospiraceae bacterium]|nr:hypothetical protein [Oscillospiraceae bacterium]